VLPIAETIPFGKRFCARGKSGGGPPHSKTLARWPMTTGCAKRLGVRQSSGALGGRDAGNGNRDGRAPRQSPNGWPCALVAVCKDPAKGSLGWWVAQATSLCWLATRRTIGCQANGRQVADRNGRVARST